MNCSYRFFRFWIFCGPVCLSALSAAGCGWFENKPIVHDGEEGVDGEETDTPVDPQADDGLQPEGEGADTPVDSAPDGADGQDVPEEEVEIECIVNSDCNDGDPCNGVEACNPGTHACMTGAPAEDGFVCGEDPRRICLDGACAESACGDGFVDTGAGETCEPPNSGGCSAGCRLGCSADPDCPDDGNACNGEEFCDLDAGLCSSLNPLPDGSVCGEVPRMICRSGTCQESTCGDGFVDTGVSPPEECDDANGTDGDGCDGDCLYSCHDDSECDDGSACTLDACDVAGTHACGHEILGSGTPCRTSAGACDVEEQCDGSSPVCPPDALSPPGLVCRSSSGVCDVDDSCTGTSAACPPDGFRPAATECRASSGPCDAAESCTGSSAACPADAFSPSSQVCRAAADACDAAENCTGISAACPSDSLLASGTVCRPAAGTCDADERCTGTSASCPADAFLPAAQVCRPVAGVCDREELCTGSSASCPADAFLPPTTTCRASAGACDVQELCTGSSAACPSDAFAPSGTPCSDGNPCTTPDTCDGSGTCTGAPSTALSGVVLVTTGFDHTCALLETGAVRCWGYNNVGQLGNGTTTSSSVPVGVTGMSSGVVQVMAGGGSSGGYTCALLETGGIKCWGYNVDGELGNGTNASTSVPTDVSGLTSGVAFVSTGYGHTCALLEAGGAKCWGMNFDGRVGDGTTVDRNTPVNVSGLTSGVAAVDAGGVHSCALLAAGGMKCWGRNTDGELGNGLTTDSSVPVDVVGLPAGVASISVGGFHTCARTGGGQLLCWGMNGDGQVGNGTLIQQLTPVQVSGLTTGVASVAGARYFTCARMSAGGEKCWGDNTFGQLGNGLTADSSVPVDVAGLPLPVAEIGDGYNYTHACTLLSDGTVRCWGDNTFGQLGDGTTTDSLSPVTVLCQ